MAGIYRNSPYPKEVTINQSAVPVFTSVGDPAMAVTTTTTEVNEISFTNTTSTTINVTVTDGNNVPLANFSNYPIDANTPYELQFAAARNVSGVKIYAPSAGLKVSLKGWRHPGFTAQ